MIRAGVVTVSDKGFAGERADESGKAIIEILKAMEAETLEYVIVPDERDKIASELIRMADELDLDLVLTTGGTGFSPRDVTPEATMDVIDRQVPGIPEAIRAYSMGITHRAMLSRATAGIRKSTLIINLPGSPKSVAESLNYILPSLPHGIQILRGQTGECAANIHDEHKK